MKAAIVGCGNIANIHAKNLKILGVELALVVDNNLEAAQAFKDKWQAGRAAKDYKEIFETDVDVVHICIPPALHYQVVKDCLEAGRQVLCEKPLTLSLKEAKELVSLSQRKGLLAAVNFNVRYYPAIDKARALLREEKSRLSLIEASYKQAFHVLPAPYGWRYKPELGGDMRAVTEIGSHLIDLVRYLSGQEISRLSAQLRSINPYRTVKDGLMYPAGPDNYDLKVDSEDVGIISFELKDKTPGTLVLSEVSHGRTNQVRIEMTGQQRNVWWDSEEAGLLNWADAGGPIKTDKDPFDGGFPDSFLSLARRFYEAIAEGKKYSSRAFCPADCPDFPDFVDGYENMKVAQAIKDSQAQDGAWINLD